MVCVKSNGKVHIIRGCVPASAGITGGSMKAKIHPNYVDAVVKCACGETFKTRSTKPEIHLEICSKCHPFFTGKQKLIDTAGRVERFNRKYKKGSKTTQTEA